MEMLQRVNPQDILTTRFHSRDFNTSRAEYISIRVRTLALLFAILAPLWIPIDFFVMDEGTFWQIVVLRIVFSISLLALSVWGTSCNLLHAAHLRLFLFILIPSLFFMASHLMFDGAEGEHAVLLGYAFLPLLIMALLTIVPLTLLEGAIFTGMLILLFILTKLMLGTMGTLGALSDLWLLLLLAAVALWVQMTQLHMLMRLHREATRDALTGLVNRRVLSSKLEQEIANNNPSLVLLLFDLDLFKRINDNFGHHTGDNVLKAFSGILRDHCEGRHEMGRYGGEEFLAILPQTSIADACKLAESIRLACHSYTIHASDDESQEIHFTTSIGVATRRPGERADEMLQRVDVGLYQAKSSGRDMVVVAD